MVKAVIEDARKIRELIPLTGEQLAAKAKVSLRSVRYVEAGNPVKISTARKIAKAIGVPVADIKIIED